MTKYNHYTSRSLKKLCSLLLLYLFSFLNGFSQENTNYPLIRTPENVPVNTTMPEKILSETEAIPVSFSQIPTDDEIYAVHFFEEPLVPAKGAFSGEENMALVYALAAYSQRKISDDFEPLLTFLDEHPRSRWQGALLANLGIVYRRSGYYSLALKAWEQSWYLIKHEKEQKIKTLADKVMSELLMINAWVGRQDEMQKLLEEVKDRTIEGPATERIAAAKYALHIMKTRPEVSFKCGPFAIEVIKANKSAGKAVFNKKIFAVTSTSKGFSLFELQKMAAENGLKYQMAFRSAGAPVIFNAVVHWKLDHYSALLSEANGYLKCHDATAASQYGLQFWLSPAALDSSASGYFLVPAGALPKGWRKVNEEEGSKIFGKGNSPPDNGNNVTPTDPQIPDNSCNMTPMAQSNVHAGAVSLHIFDRPVYYTPPKGPSMFWEVRYHHRDTYQPANFTYANMGPKWTFNWLSYIIDDPNNPTANASVYVMGGGVKTFTGFDITTQRYQPHIQTSDVLVRICPNCYEIRHPDGSKEVYARSDGNTSNGRKIFLTKKVDATGIELSLTYDANLRITAIVDALGQVTTIGYQNTDIYKITRVTDPFGRLASFQYDGSGRLISITDMIGIVSAFQYNTSDFIQQMTTPYGVTRFIADDGIGVRSLETHFPLGEKERVEFREQAPGIGDESVVPSNGFNQYLTYRNTFFWDKKAMSVAPGVYTSAKIFHWLHGSAITGENGSISPLFESIKEPLENRVWYSYQNQNHPIFENQGMSPKPAREARILDDGTEQARDYTYNKLGYVTTSTDPVGRKLTYVYDTTFINLLEVRQTTGSANDLLAKYTYNKKYQPLTYRDASGLTTRYTYNTAGQLLTVKNPKNEVTTYTYNSKGYLTKLTGPVTGSSTLFTYDGYGRLRTVTDPEGYKITTDYDVLDRPTVITYPDGSYEQFVYDRLDAVHKRDRIGRWSHTIYDSLRRESANIDPLGRITQFIWCKCGSIAEIIDPLKNITTFNRDIRGRITTKTYNDGKSINYVYENTTSRIKQVTDAKGQTKNYTYFADDNLKSLSYTNAVVSTPTVSFTYDANYNRVLTMVDGTGTTKYAYKNAASGLGSNMLSSVDGPLSSDVIKYTYDSVGRVSSRSINNVPSSMLYDPMGRLTNETNALGSFGYQYVNQTSRLSSVNYPNGQRVEYTYYPNASDNRLKQIWNRNSDGSTLSKFIYEYDKVGQITKWTQQEDSATINYDDLTYDLSDQLIAATKKSQINNSIIKQYAYQYDKAGNRTSEQVDNTITSSVHNTLNQLTAQQSGGPMRFFGKINEAATVQLQNLTSKDTVQAFFDSASKSFEGFVRMLPASANRIRITAKDFSGNNNTRVFNDTILVGNGTNNTLTYDNNGNTVSSANPAVTYGWDAEDRLVKITMGANVTEFVYDGLSRRVAEKLNGSIVKRWLWDGNALAEERNSAGSTVTKRFFAQGEQIAGVNYYFFKDHLGSVREMKDANGMLMARYIYDPYGRRSKISGAMEADFGFTGHYYHAGTTMHLTLYRAYTASQGRWLSRDPLGESEGTNLYQYVSNNPIDFIDRYGQDKTQAIIIKHGLNKKPETVWKRLQRQLSNLMDRIDKSIDIYDQLKGLKDRTEQRKKCYQQQQDKMFKITDEDEFINEMYRDHKRRGRMLHESAIDGLETGVKIVY